MDKQLKTIPELTIQITASELRFAIRAFQTTDLPARDINALAGLWIQRMVKAQEESIQKLKEKTCARKS